MKILQIGKFYPIRGGVEKVMLDLTEGLSERGVDCDMLCASETPQVIELNGHGRVVCVKALAKWAATMISPGMVRRMRRVCREYDVVHIHHPDPMACLALFLSGYRGKVVLHWHSDILKQRVLLQLYRPLQNWLIRRADLIVGTTPVYLAESPCLQRVQHKTRCLPIGIERMRQDATGAATIRQRYAGKRIVFSLGRLIGYKGYRYLVEAAQYLPDDVVVLIGGTGPLRADLQAQIDRLQLQGKVELLGFVKDEEVPAYYGACDLFCLPSIQKTEAFGIVQIEAMSCGKPVVATRIPESGVAWVNAHGVSGLNVEPEDAKVLAEAIEAILKDETVYRNFSEGARRHFEEYFTRERMLEDCLQIYRNLLG